ncbi:PEP-CTERM sorting domain-containing protein [Tabrizicola sp. TH137]|uniref:PEP-CTERM sorting domain-containing protein n=1 Tax=Tabrizicola sp. TH137 TaxID=2067452 RepID=UPI001303F53B|nr:PEP-CTERM sorting domain-containing protein [Tabrizicola sp. TH137]
MMKALVSLAVSLVLMASTAQAAVFLTSDSHGYSGPVLNMTGYTGPFIKFDEPITLADGTTVIPAPGASPGGSIAGAGLIDPYAFDQNGISRTTPLIGSNARSGFLELRFTSLISSFGGFWNYARGDRPNSWGDNPVIAAFDSLGNELGSFDLARLAPISTPGQIDSFAFRAIQSDKADIATIRFGGSFLAYAPSVAAVPVPAALPLLLAAFGLLGLMAHRRKAC